MCIRDRYVADYANVMEEEDKSHIISLSNSLEKECGAQIAVLTTNDLQGLDIEKYSRETGNAWGLGAEDKDNGVIIVPVSYTHLDVYKRQIYLRAAIYNLFYITFSSLPLIFL